MADKIKILGFSDSIPVPTGYSRVCKEIFSRLDSSKFDYFHFGKQSFGQPRIVNYLQDFYEMPIEEKFEEATKQKILDSPEAFSKWFYSNFSRELPMHSNQDGSDIIDFHLSSVKPDIYFQLLDLWMANWVLKKDFTPAKSVVYYPADGYPLPSGCHQHILKADVPVAMSKFTKQLTEENVFFDESTGQKVNLRDRLTRPIEYIPHGVDTSVYHPLPKGPDSEWHLSKIQQQIAGRYVFGMVARNQPRKSHERLFKAFSKFQKGKPDVALWLHCDPRDPQGYDLINMARRFDVTVHFTKMPSFKWGISDELLNKIYNLMDVHVLSTTGEGFGLPIVEAEAAGLPQVLVDYTTSRELMGLEPKTNYPDIYQRNTPELTHTEMGILSPCVTLIDGTMEVERGIPDVNSLVDSFQYCYDNQNEMRRRGRNARENAVNNYDWNNIVKQWESLFTKTVNGEKQ